jgi:hypothetical protein
VPQLEPDATSKLAADHARSLPENRPLEAAGPGPDTPCDRCHKLMWHGQYALSRYRLHGTPSTWWICLSCDRELVRWWNQEPRPQRIGGT